MSHAPTPEQKKEAELEMATEGAMMCLGARDHVEKLTDRELVSAVEKQIWAKLCGFGSQEDWLLDELINRFESQRGIKRDDEGNLLPDDKARVDFLKEHTHFEFWVHHPDYDVHGGKRFNAEGIVFREVVDSAIAWRAKHV